jgi:MSHA pilin protein MshD
MFRGSSRAARGVTLIELVVAITIVSIAAVAVIGAMSVVSARSADAMIRQQGVALAEAYLEEIILKPVVDPDGIAETGRANFDDVDDYNGLLDVGAHDQLGNAILGSYTVSVAVVPTNALSGVPSSAARRIDITVTHPAGTNVLLSGYTAGY